MRGRIFAVLVFFPLALLAGEEDPDKLVQVGISAHHNFSANIDPATQVKKDWEAGFTLGVQPFHHLGFEAEYFNSFGGVTSQHQEGGATIFENGTDNLRGRLLKAVVNYPVLQKLEVFAKAGYGDLQYSDSTTQNSSISGTSSQSRSVTWRVVPVAVGLEFFPERNLSVELAYDKFVSSRRAEAWTAGLKYHF